MALRGQFGEPLFITAQLERSRKDHTSWLLRNGPRLRERHGFFDVMGKIGDGPVVGGHYVYSEILGVRHIATGRRFLLSYQNATGIQAAYGPLSDYVFPKLGQYVAATTIAF